MASERGNGEHLKIHRPAIRRHKDVHWQQTQKSGKSTTAAGVLLKNRETKAFSHTSLRFFWCKTLRNSWRNMVLANSYYYTPKLEIKPQPGIVATSTFSDYYTPKLEIKPQPSPYS